MTEIEVISDKLSNILQPEIKAANGDHYRLGELIGALSALTAHTIAIYANGNKEELDEMCLAVESAVHEAAVQNTELLRELGVFK